MTDIQLTLDNSKTYAFSLTAKYKGGIWSAEETWSSSDNKTTLLFALKPQEPGTLSVNADISLVKDSVTSAKIWISDSPAVDRTQFPVQETPMPFTSGTVEFSDTYPSGKHWILMELADKSGEITIVGPELAYVFPNVTTSWTPRIEVLNKNYTITFSQEGMEYGKYTNKITADLVAGASLPEPYVQNIYATSEELPNLDYDLLKTPAGYGFYGWWDGKSMQDGEPVVYNYWSNTVSGGTYTDDITLYPLWENTGFIYDYSTKDEIEAYISAQSKDNQIENIVIFFQDGFEYYENNTDLWNNTISALGNSEINKGNKGVELVLSYIGEEWFADNLSSVAGTSDNPNNWLEEVSLPSMSKIPSGAFSYCTALESISIPSGVTEIGSNAFDHCSALTTLEFKSPTSIQTIGESAFSGTAIKEFTIFENIESVGDGAFKDCTALESIKFATPNYQTTNITIGNYAFENTAISSLSLKYSVTSIGDGAFKNCKELANIYLGSTSNLASIGKSAFEGCAFSTVTLPKSVITMGEAAFAKNTNLTEFLFESNYKIHKIPARCFYGCSDLSKIQLGAGITYVDYDAFFGTALKKETENTRDFACTNQYAAQWTIFTLNEDFQPISCTRSSDIESAIVTNKEKDTERNIERYVRDFSLAVNTPDEIYSYIEECKTLNSVIPLGICGGTFEWDDVKNIIADITCENTNGIELILTSLVIARDASIEKKTIPAGFFEGKTWLTKISLPHYSSDSPYISVIGDNAFSGCTNLTSITMIDGLTKIGKNAFSGCKNLEITLPEGCAYLGAKAFENVKSVLASLVTGNWTQVTVVDGNASYAHITVDDWKSTIKNEKSSSAFYRDVPLSAFSSTAPDTARVQQMYAIAQDLGVITLPMWISAEESPITLTSENAAFNTTISSVAGTSEVYFDLHLEQLTLDGDKTISSGCFNGTSTAKNLWLGSVTLPVGTAIINNNAFEYCGNLKKVSFANSTSLTRIGTSAFEYCTKLSTFNSDTTGTLEMPENVTEIGSYPFTDAAFITADLSKATALTTIPALLFYSNRKLTSFKLPIGVTKIENFVFHHCRSLESVDLQEYTNLTTLGAGVFSDCQNLTSISFPDSITTFNTVPGRSYDTENGILYGTSKLTAVTLPPNLTGIPCNAFNSSAITTIELPATVLTIDGNAFKDSSITTVTFKGSASAPETKEITLDTLAFTGASELNSIAFADAATSTVIKVTGDITDWALLSYLKNMETETDKTISLDMSECNVGTGKSAKALADQMFYGGTSAQYKTKIGSFLQSISLPEGITSIGTAAFSGAGLTSITLPKSLTYISDRAFQSCTKLKEIKVEGDDSDTWLGAYSWQGQPTHKVYFGITNTLLSSLLVEDTADHDFSRNPQNLSSVISSIPDKINNYNGNTPAETFTITISGRFDDWSYFSALSEITKTTTIDMGLATDSSADHTVPAELLNHSYITISAKPHGTN
ncbi:MAG: leucine-rich repeat domain-containing protein [Treponemataceae bacterium]|nr:leucine-rich repeat domain-containing protein [Treponemataceae bacterium]